MPAWDAQRYIIENVSRNAILASSSGRASNTVSRGFGLMLHRDLPEGGGLIIEPCNSVVSFFMRFPIDVLFVDRTGAVVRMIHAMPPWRGSPIVRDSAVVVELPAGTLARTETRVGHSIRYYPVAG